MKIVVFGANGPTGRRVVQQGLDAGHEIVAVTRKPDTYPLHAQHLHIALADVNDPHAVSRAAIGTDAVISTYGVPYTRRAVCVYSQGMTNILRVAKANKINRVVCVTSTTVSPGEAPGESLAWRKLVIPVLRNIVGRTVYDDMQRMERLVQASDLKWTIVRPGGLFDTSAPTSDYVVSSLRLQGRVTSRADLAQTLLREATEDLHVCAAIEVITRSQLPSFRQIISRSSE